MKPLKETELLKDVQRYIKKPTIIVADDEEIMREVLFDQLTEKGYDVRSAADGAEAWELFQQQPCEILMTDLEMPRMTGIELIEKVKMHSPTTVAIALTGYGTLDSARKLIDLGCNEYLLKPIKDINEIDIVLKRSLERNRLLMQESVYKRIDMAKSRLLHELTYNLVEPTYSLLNSIDILISRIKEGDVVKALPIAEDIKKKVNGMTMMMGRLTESSNQLNVPKGA
jgi:YesN/AraC family two-component response regulator